VLAPYATGAAGYAALFPYTDLGNDLAVALYAAGARDRAPAVLKRAELAIKSHTGEAMRLPRADMEEARQAAVRLTASGPVTILRAVAHARVTLYERVEVIEAMRPHEAVRRPEAMLLAPTGQLVEKALNLRLPVDFRVFTKRMAGQLQQLDRALALPEIRTALEALDFNWASMSGAQIDKAFVTAQKAMKAVASGPLLPAWSEKIQAGLETVIGGVKKYLKEAFTPRIALGFNQEDRKAVKQVGDQAGWFLRDELGVRSDKLTARGRRIVADGLAKGLGQKTIGDQLRAQLPQLWQRYGAGYANTVASNAVNRARSYSELSGYNEAGIQYLEVQAMLDERTTEICRYMDGQIIDVQQCTALLQRGAEVKRPEDIAKVNPFLRTVDSKGGHPTAAYRAAGKPVYLATTQGARVAQVLRSGVGNVDDRGQHRALAGGSKLPQKGVGMPPYHHNCRSLTVPRIEMVQVPADRFGRAPLVPQQTLACGGYAAKGAVHKASSKAACSAFPGKSKKAAQNPVQLKAQGATTGTDASKKGGKNGAKWKPPARTIKLPEGKGLTLSDHQKAILSFRKGKPPVLKFKDPEILDSVKGPVLKQLAVTKKWPDGVKYYTFIDPAHVDKLKAEIALKGGGAVPPPKPAPKPKVPKKPPPGPTPAPPPQTPKPAPKPAAAPAPAPKPAVPPPAGNPGAPGKQMPALSARELSLNELRASSMKYNRWAQKYTPSGRTHRNISKDVGATITDEELRKTARFLRAESSKAQGIVDYLDAMDEHPVGSVSYNMARSGALSSLHEELVRNWNWGYVRTHSVVTGIHRAVAAEFSTTTARVPALRDAAENAAFNKAWTPKVESGMRKWARAVYNETQRVLQEKGVTEIVGKRGVAFSRDTDVPGVQFPRGRRRARNEILTSKNYPLTAFAAATGEANKFLSSTSKGTILRRQFMVTRVPAERIWSIPNTGCSVEKETEFIAIGGEDEVLSLSWTGPGVPKNNQGALELDKLVTGHK